VRQCPRCPADIEIPSVQHFLCNTLGGGELFPARIQQLGDSSLFAICLLNCDVEVAAIVPRTGRTNRMQATARSGLYVFHKVICSPSPDPRRSPASRGIAELHVAADWTPASREIQTLQRTLLRRADEVPHSQKERFPLRPCDGVLLVLLAERYQGGFQGERFGAFNLDHPARILPRGLRWRWASEVDSGFCLCDFVVHIRVEVSPLHLREFVVGVSDLNRDGLHVVGS